MRFLRNIKFDNVIVKIKKSIKENKKFYLTYKCGFNYTNRMEK